MTWLEQLVDHASSSLNDRVREELYARGVSDEQIAVYRLGYLDKRLPDGVLPSAFLDWSLHGRKLDDVFVLPLTNAAGIIKGLQFRHVERGRGRYMDYFQEKGEAVLFGLGQAMVHSWITGRIVLVEGGFDLFPLQRYHPEVTATLTAHLSDLLVKVLRRVGVTTVWLVYDRDKPGREASSLIQKQYGSEFKVRVIAYPEVKRVDSTICKDPSDLWEAWGEAKFSVFAKSLMRQDLENFDGERNHGL